METDSPLYDWYLSASIIPTTRTISWKPLAMVTIVMSIPTMIFSAYGMNFKNNDLLNENPLLGSLSYCLCHDRSLCCLPHPKMVLTPTNNTMSIYVSLDLNQLSKKIKNLSGSPNTNWLKTGNQRRSRKPHPRNSPSYPWKPRKRNSSTGPFWAPTGKELFQRERTLWKRASEINDAPLMILDSSSLSLVFLLGD